MARRGGGGRGEGWSPSSRDPPPLQGSRAPLLDASGAEGGRSSTLVYVMNGWPRTAT